MALFNKLFSTHKRKNVAASTTNKNTKQFPFSNEQVRILLYRECDWRGRRLLFDSTALQKIPSARSPPATTTANSTTDANTNSNKSEANLAASNAKAGTTTPANYIDTVDGVGYRYAKPTETDYNAIGEMVFGSVAMAVRSTSLKVHWLTEPTRFLCSQVFVTPVAGAGQHQRASGLNGSGRLRDLSAASIAADAASSSASMDTSSLNSFSLSVSVMHINDQQQQQQQQHDHQLRRNGRSDVGVLNTATATSTHPLDVPGQQQQQQQQKQQHRQQQQHDDNANRTNGANGKESTSAAANNNAVAGLAYSDSGYGGTDPWSNCSSVYYPYNSSTRSSFGSVYSDRGDIQSAVAASVAARKFSIDSSSMMSSAEAAALSSSSRSSTNGMADLGGSGGGDNGDMSDVIGGGGIQRRILRSMTTSFEGRGRSNDCVGYVGDQLQQQWQQQQQLQQAATISATHLTVGGRASNGGSEGCVRTGRRSSAHQTSTTAAAAETHSNPEMMRRFHRTGLGAVGSSAATAAALAARSVGGGGGGGSGSAGSRSRTKLGLAICIQLSDNVETEMQMFCAEHIVLLESMLCRLRANAEAAYANQKRFYQLMLHAWMSTAQWFVDLYTAPRLVEPVWLALSGGHAHNARQLAQGFMQELSWLLNCADTKDTNFFISTLLTAILTHHLGWVGTVAPIAYDASARTAASADGKHQRATMSELARFHPYNVLWAQLSDLYGAIGSPPKVSKTIVCGTQEPTVGKVLNVLTYFIRCGLIEREQHTEVFEKQKIDTIMDEYVGRNKAACEAEKARAETVATGRNGMTRTSTCVRNLSDVLTDDDETSSQSTLGRKNDIPNVLIYRDSRLVRQELRIGNLLMDTGIEMTGKQRQDIREYRVKDSVGKTPVDAVGVRVLVTSPTVESEFTASGCDGDDNVDGGSLTGTDDTVEEATESLTIADNENDDDDRPFETKLTNYPSLSDLITANSVGNTAASRSTMTATNNHPSPAAVGFPGEGCAGAGSSFLWGIEPIKEGVSEEQWQHIEKGARLKGCFSDGQATDVASSIAPSVAGVELKRSKSLYAKSTNVKNVERIRRSKSRKNIVHADGGGDNDAEAAVNDDNNAVRRVMEDDREAHFTTIDPSDEHRICGGTLRSVPSLSDLITANSCGASERLTWGIEPVKESVTLDEVHHFENNQKRIESQRPIGLASTSMSSLATSAINSGGGGVVFVLGGDNEKLANLKSSSPARKSPNLVAPQSMLFPHVVPTTLTKPTSTNVTANVNPQPTVARKTCSHKKHSGVKFNFEKYPQIATNYMKNKNIDLAHYDFNADKAHKLDTEDTVSPASSSSRTVVDAPDSNDDDDDSSECECCAGNATRTLLQTPSNATELEFSNDDRNYPTSTAEAATSMVATNAGKSMSNTTSTSASSSSSTKSDVLSNVVPAEEPTLAVTPKPSVKVLTLPISSSQKQPSAMTTTTQTPLIMNKNSRNQTGNNQSVAEAPAVKRAGFAPSLLLGITDHYVADMVLQGTTAPMSSWENSLKQNLALSAHCAMLEPRVTENVAILANTDKWDVKVVSSQTYVLPCGSGTSGPIGMSQLVATMLETANAMWSAGLPAHQCMSYLESKLHELYMQSETLAAFLLATEFCSLSTVTSVLDVSANDVPLLLSVASVHSPQVTKKYGVSFR